MDRQTNSKNNNQKQKPSNPLSGFLPAIGLAIIILLAAAIFYFWQNQTSQSLKNEMPKNTASSMDAENWKEYADKNFKYYFKYPKNWELEISSGLSENKIIPDNRQSCGIISKEWACLDLVYFGVVENKKGLEIKDFFIKELGWEENFNFKNIRETEINGNKVYKVTTINAFDGDSNESLWTPIDSYFFKISGSYLNEEQNDILEKIFSTFDLMD